VFEPFFIQKMDISRQISDILAQNCAFMLVSWSIKKLGSDKCEIKKVF